MLLFLKSVLVIATFTSTGNLEYNLPVVNDHLQATGEFTFDSPLACTNAMAEALNSGLHAGCYNVDTAGFVVNNPPIQGAIIDRGGWSQTRQPDSVIELRVNHKSATKREG